MCKSVEGKRENAKGTHITTQKTEREKKLTNQIREYSSTLDSSLALIFLLVWLAWDSFSLMHTYFSSWCGFIWLILTYVNIVCIYPACAFTCPQSTLTLHILTRLPIRLLLLLYDSYLNVIIAFHSNGITNSRLF